jgi:hypothetical protein
VCLGRVMAVLYIYIYIYIMYVYIYICIVCTLSWHGSRLFVFVCIIHIYIYIYIYIYITYMHVYIYVYIYIYIYTHTHTHLLCSTHSMRADCAGLVNAQVRMRIHARVCIRTYDFARMYVGGHARKCRSASSSSLSQKHVLTKKDDEADLHSRA